MPQAQILEVHKAIRLNQGYRWGKNVLSIPLNGTIYLYNTLAQSYVKFLGVAAISKGAAVNDNAVLQKLDSLSLITRLEKAEEDSQYFTALHNLQQRSGASNYTIAPTLDCNCQCPYCFVRKDAVSMSVAAADILAAYIRDEHQRTGRPPSITWYGGEPLLAVGTIQRISRFLIDSDIPFSSDIITNGLLVSAGTVKILRDSRVSGAQLTLDGYLSDHNTIRNTPGKPCDTYSAVLAAAARLIAGNFHLKIRVNCSSENIDNIHKLADCPQLSALDRAKFVIYFETIDTSPQVRSRLKTLQELFSKTGYRVLDGLPKNSLHFHSCSALRDSDYSIGPSLELYDCYSDLGNKKRVTGVLTQGSPAKSFYTTTGLLPAICADCPVLPFCYARGCPYKLARTNFIHDEAFCAELKERIHNVLLEKLANKYGH